MAGYNFKEVEESVLSYWEEQHTHEQLQAKLKHGKKFYFLDGPPYTSGQVHIGTAWNKSLKDMVLRYKRMHGFHVWDRAGYDMHGLPTAHAVEKKLGIRKQDIPAFGVGRFIEECRKLSVENMLKMNQDFKRMGVWMDFEHAYQSITPGFIEGVWWLIKKAHEHGRLYEGLKSISWCQKCGSSLAKHELDYTAVTDASIYVKLKIVDKPYEFLVIWTTTPWTLPFNLGVMVHPDYEYGKYRVDGELWIMAKHLAPSLLTKLKKDIALVTEITGKDLVGTRYEHPLYGQLKHVYDDIHAKSPKAHTVVSSSEYVDLTAGTGLVHMAPGCGPEDYEVGHREGIPPFNNLNEYGFFPDDMGPCKGLRAKQDDATFIELLGNAVVHQEKVNHEYPHCWRCKQPIIFRATKQWFFKVEDLKQQLREVNQKIQWVPDWAGSRQFDSWLENLRDNGISRQQYWGTPLPIWRCAACGTYEVIGSVAELREKGATVPEDLHIPFIDTVTFPCKCGTVMHRSPDILDVWVDAGSASWNCLNYPERADLFSTLFPADFILEGKDQIRGWFNLLLINSMVSMQRPSFSCVYMHGFVQDSQGRKMSKSLGNYILPSEVIEKYGADTLRYYMIGGAQPAVDINYNFDDLKVKHRNLLILWNLQNLLLDMAKTSQLTAGPIPEHAQLGIEEKYILSRLHSTIRTATQKMDDYVLNEVPWLIEQLYLDLSRTYVQMVREKMATGTKEEKEVIFRVLLEIYKETLKMFSIIAPFISEKVYLNLREAFGFAEESISFHGWPVLNEWLINAELEKTVTLAGVVMRQILAAREKLKLGVRWPLKEVVIIPTDAEAGKALEQAKEIIATQTNVKHVRIDAAFPLEVVIRPNFSEIQKSYGKESPKILAHIVNLSYGSILQHIQTHHKYMLSIDRNTFEIRQEHIEVTKQVKEPYVLFSSSAGEILVNQKQNKELEAEGYAREMMRSIQQFRKEMGLVKTDRIVLGIEGDETILFATKDWEEQIKEKVGADSLEYGALADAQEDAFAIRQHAVKMWVKKV
ncbi:isoleucine--tRNA ligase [Candidatus Woesearchaeota archaeon]|nr:isoleucine--tRNA ligase [Candidatus Woesearchaeota archaeon]